MEKVQKKLKNFFKDLSFKEKEHKYSVKGRPIEKSVSKLIENFYEEFDVDAIAPYSAIKAGVTTEEIKAQWAAINLESRERGHRVHAFGELYQYNRRLKPSCPQEEAIVKFWKDIPEHIIPVEAELRMYHFREFYAGTADFILYDTKANEYIIGDYKTNKDLYKNFQGKTMLAPFEYLLDMPLSHYQIQLSYYQILLEQIGVKVSKRLVVWLKLDGEYEMIFLDDVTDKI
jgi:hypothetical protein